MLFSAGNRFGRCGTRRWRAVRCLQGGRCRGELLTFRREQHLLQAAGFGQPRLGFGRASEFGRKHSRVGKEPRIDGALGQRLLHVRPCLVGTTGRGERPRQRIVRENVRAGLQFALRKLNR